MTHLITLDLAMREDALELHTTYQSQQHYTVCISITQLYSTQLYCKYYVNIL